MCGITGIVCADRRPASPVIVRRMTDALEHRGPDGEGFCVYESVAFGHRRLSIIDLSPAGDQPMTTADGTHTLTYNGETYNFRELRAELEALGHRFRSRTDSEVVLEAYAEWGLEAVERLNGMFAFAVLDRARRQVVLARDRYGVKPLYYAFRGGSLLFASEIKALLRHPDCRAELDEDALLEYFTFQNFLGDRTLFRGIQILPAGCTLTVGSRRAGRREHPEVLGLQVRGARAAVRRRRGVRARARPALPAGGRPPARERRAGGLVSQRGNGHRRGHLAGERSRCRGCAPSRSASTSARRRASSSGSTSGRRPSGSRTCSAPSSTRWC